MEKMKRRDGFLGCRTTKIMEETMKKMCSENKREISEVINYLCRLFLEDAGEIRTRFFGGGLEREKKK